MKRTHPIQNLSPASWLLMMAGGSAMRKPVAMSTSIAAALSQW